MNRKIKFKAFNKKKKRIVQVLKLDLWGAEYEQRQIYTNEGQTLNQDEFELLEWTGFLDIKKEEVYEAYILKTNCGIYKVVFRDGMFELTDSEEEEFISFWQVNSFEVIGNIHENPELMEVSS